MDLKVWFLLGLDVVRKYGVNHNLGTVHMRDKGGR